MIMGDRGTGKSTTIRALADLLPDIQIIKNDPFNTNPKGLEEEYETEAIKIPMVELPLGATEDRVCGTINLKEILSGGNSTFEPGLLARANRGILYVDEINLLDDHLVDVLLDSAASGWNTVEREGISIKHPAKFILVGSGNPEEGELRPQLLDRFGMHAEIRTIREPDLRVKVVEERINFDISPQIWFDRYEKEQLEMRAAHRAMRLPENSGKTLRDLIHEAQLRGSNDRMPIIIRKNNPNKSGDVERRVVKNKRGEKSSRFQKQLEQNADNGLLDKNLFEMDFIKQVKRYRSKNLLTQKDLAQKINVKEHEIRSFERNELLYDASLKALLTSVLNE